ncbi:MAG: carboxypeptidase M32 [Proteobacteria bacterium]|nr:carboxypeptidase M32 [Pseudomonadota bacterium]
MNVLDAYQWLKNHSVETSYLGSLGTLNAWDQRTYIPVKGHAHRAEQLAVLAKLLHERITDQRIAEYLAKIEGTDLVADPTSPESANAREWRKAYDRATKIPKKLVEEIARTTSKCETVWERARPKNDWKTFEPHLERVFRLLDEKAQALGYKEEKYDALLEDYESGETAESVKTMFNRMSETLVEILGKIQGSSVRPDREILRRHFPIDAQKQFSKTVAAAIGYDLEAGRIDATAHPFTIGIGPGDVRITTRYFENYFPGALFGTIHEAGHAMYEQGLPAEHWGTPRGEAISLGIHESQSRLWENLVGRSHGMWRRYFSEAKELFASLSDVDFDRFLLAINAVEPSLIRVEADEVTYNLHILLRFDLELGMMRGDLSVKDLPEAWREKMKTYLGVDPPDVASGVMQDVHWSAGLVGYFPTYTLGNIYSAQLYHYAEQKLGNLQEQFSKGEFKPLLEWLRENIHTLGGTYKPRELIREATGSAPDPSYLIRYWENKYSRLYEL